MHIVRVAVAIVLGVWIYLASSLGDAERDTEESAAVSDADSESARNGSTNVSRAARGAARSRARLDPQTARGRTRRRSPIRASRRLRRIPPRKARYFAGSCCASGTLVNYLGIPDRAWSAGVAACSFRNRIPACHPTRHSKTKSTTGCSTARCFTSRPGATPTASSASGKLVRLPQAEGWTQIYAVGPGRKP